MPLLLIILGVLVTIAGGVSYYFLLDVVWLRDIGWPNIIVMLAGLALTISAGWKTRRKLTVGLAVGQTLFIALFVVSLTVFTVLPAPQRTVADSSVSPDAAPPSAREAPTFTLPDHTGDPVSLADTLARGPVLLVFYRGFW